MACRNETSLRCRSEVVKSSEVEETAWIRNPKEQMKEVIERAPDALNIKSGWSHWEQVRFSITGIFYFLSSRYTATPRSGLFSLGDILRSNDLQGLFQLRVNSMDFFTNVSSDGKIRDDTVMRELIQGSSFQNDGRNPQR